MGKYVIAAVVGCLYTAGSAWLVHSEGRLYRDALRGPSVTAKAAPRQEPSVRQRGDIATGSTRGPVPKPDPNPPGSGSEPPPSRPKPSGEESSPAPEVTRRGKPAEKTPAGPPAPTPAVAPRTKEAIPRPTEMAIAKTPIPAAVRKAWDPFWDQPQVKKSWDLARLSTQDEIQLGNDLHDMILRFNPPLDDGTLQRRVEETAEPLVKTCTRKEIPYTFTILNTDAVNAFSHPGGHVYVTKGLLDMLSEDEDYALEFAIGHEIAHVDLRHAIRCLQDPKVLALGLGTLQKIYLFIVPLAYLDEHEYQADEWIYRRMKQHRDRTNRECLSYIRKLGDRAKKYNYDNGRGKPNPGKDTSPLDNHLRAHTAPYKRLNQLKELMGKA